MNIVSLSLELLIKWQEVDLNAKLIQSRRCSHDPIMFLWSHHADVLKNFLILEFLVFDFDFN